MVRVGVSADASTGIRIWSKAAALHFTVDPRTGRIVQKPPSGGFVQVTPTPAALRLHSVPANWHALGSPADHAAKATPNTPVPLWQQYLDLGEHAEGFLTFSNFIAWQLQHGLIGEAEDNARALDIDRLWNHFVAGSRIYAREMARHARPGETQMLHDNHLWLVPHFFRTDYASIASRIPIGVFIHTPQAAPVAFEKLLGRERATMIFRGLDAADSVMFQTDDDALAFEEGRAEFLGRNVHAKCSAIHVEIDQDEIEQLVGLRSVPVDEVSTEDEDELARQRRNALRGVKMVQLAKKHLGAGGKVIVSSMRLDRAKGTLELVNGLQALISTYPKHLGRLHVILRTPESRNYETYKAELTAAIDLANQRYSLACRKHGISPTMPLIRRYSTNSRGAAIGATRMADVAVYPSLADGYNISALEAVVASDAAAIVVGETAGVVRTLGHDCLTIDPMIPSDVASALHFALELSAPERQDRLHRMRQQLERGGSKVQWLLDRARDINGAFLLNQAAATTAASAPVDSVAS